MIVADVDMHPIIWFIVLGPPCLAFVLWQGIGLGAKTGNTIPWQTVQLGKYSYWVIPAIIYTATIATALLEHRI